MNVSRNIFVPHNVYVYIYIIYIHSLASYQPVYIYYTYIYNILIFMNIHTFNIVYICVHYMYILIFDIVYAHADKSIFKSCV